MGNETRNSIISKNTLHLLQFLSKLFVVLTFCCYCTTDKKRSKVYIEGAELEAYQIFY